MRTNLTTNHDIAISLRNSLLNYEMYWPCSLTSQQHGIRLRFRNRRNYRKGAADAQTLRRNKLAGVITSTDEYRVITRHQIKALYNLMIEQIQGSPQLLFDEVE